MTDVVNTSCDSCRMVREDKTLEGNPKEESGLPRKRCLGNLYRAVWEELNLLHDHEDLTKFGKTGEDMHNLWKERVRICISNLEKSL